jgi:hypothetical protein
MSTLEKLCKLCGKVFILNSSLQQFCGRSCANKDSQHYINQRVSLVTVVCKTCGKIYYKLPSRVTKFCSYKCSNNDSERVAKQRGTKRLPKNCKVCNMIFIPKWDKKNEFCSKLCFNRYLNELRLTKFSTTPMGIGGFRPDLNQYFRSRLEANYARILKYSNVKYKYEPKTFNLLGGRYTPDFYLSETNEYIELKGRPLRLDRVEQFHQTYPNIKLTVIYQDSKEWKDLNKQYKTLLNWEN